MSKSYKTFSDWLHDQSEAVQKRMEMISGALAWDQALLHSEHVKQLEASHRIKMENSKQPVNAQLLEVVTGISKLMVHAADEDGECLCGRCNLIRKARAAIAAAEAEQQPRFTPDQIDAFVGNDGGRKQLKACPSCRMALGNDGNCHYPECCDPYTQQTPGKSSVKESLTAAQQAESKYLLKGYRFKVSYRPDARYCIEGLPAELNGQWVALVDATDNRHMQQPPASEPWAEHDLNDTRCQCCGYMTYQREHMNCIRSAQPPAVPDGKYLMSHDALKRFGESRYRDGYAQATYVEPKGYALVPIEPTRAMLDAAHVNFRSDIEIDQLLKTSYRAMLAAAKDQP